MQEQQSTTEDDGTLVFTVDEAAAKLRICRASCYEGIRTGWIPSIKIGRRVLVPKASLLRLLADPSR